MKAAKLAVTIALLLFVGATLGTLIAQETARPATTPTASGSVPSTTNGQTAEADPAEPATAEEPDLSEVGTPNEVESFGEPVCVIDAIYFHNTVRCATCMKIERDAWATIEAEFPDELEDGRLRWSTINMEEERQYVERYGLVKPTLILARTVGDEQLEWVALDDTWTLVRYEARFAGYIADSARGFLEECP